MEKKIDIGGELHSVATDHKVADASEIKDISKGNKSQTAFNNDVDRHEVEIHGPGGIDSRLTDVEQIEQIVLNGGEAQIAQYSDFTNPDATKRVKIPTVGAILDGADDVPTGNSNKLVKSGGVKTAIDARTNYLVCDTAAATAAKVVSATGFVLTNGGALKIKMANANTANNATLNINSTGAKALIYDGIQASAANTWEAGEVLDVYYDETNELFFANNVSSGGKFADGTKVKNVDVITTTEMATVLDAPLPIYLVDANGVAVLDDNGRPIEIIAEG